jgi:hypothetical protein
LWTINKADLKQEWKMTNTNLVATDKVFSGNINSLVPLDVNQPAEAKTQQLNYTRLKLNWQTISRQKIAPAYKFGSATKMPLVRNSLINEAYAEMYFSDPGTFKWAGLAAFASHSIGLNMQTLRDVSVASKSTVFLSFGTALPVWYLSSQVNKLFDELAHGNKLIFADMYWQHLAYRDGGIEELEKIYLQGDLPEKIFRVWQMLDEGKKTQNQDLIWQANIDLLEREQKDIIQPALYDQPGSELIWKLISGTHNTLGLLVYSPVPEETKLFRDVIPNGNLANSKERWDWCIKSIMPAWRSYETKNQNKVKALLKSITA